ncbi:hypothetical protein H4219_001286 [Mycoemilia scoparia]|uniref:Uncharacterized protein n=1 Tax=Mycoemilia scoparia TaxID=417184 RepID=A0A9W8DVJ2_9FUNG|nr:hypothetical protein H4219_001286 [Mycoemilia scoparia]
MIWKYGRKRGGIKESILPDLVASDDAGEMAKIMEKSWEREVRLGRYSLWRVLWDITGPTFCLAGIIGLTESIFKLGQAICLSYLIKFFQKKDKDPKEGYLIALGMCLCVLIQGFLHHHYFWPAVRSGYRARVGLIAFLFRKSLLLSASSPLSTGTVVNLISNDVQPFDTCSGYFHYIWIGPAEVIMVFAFLYINIGAATIVAVGIFILVIPLQVIISRKYSSYRSETVKGRDSRIRLQTDILSGIEVIKLSAWEKPLAKQVQALRDQEYRYLRRSSRLKVLNEAMFVSSGEIVCLFAFLTLWGITAYHGHPIAGAKGFTAAEIFPSMAFFNMVRQTATNFTPHAFEGLAEIRVSIGRIKEFLRATEDASKPRQATMAHGEENGVQGSDLVVSMDNSTMGWSSKVAEQPKAASRTSISTMRSALDNPLGPAVLFNINLKLHKGELLAITGPVGSGKSSLCYSILGEMLTLGGNVSVNTPNKAIAYASQTPWIFAGSVLDNILFGRPYNEARFRKVCTACALDHDLEIFEERELTLIGERGVSLSGGQRARVALARAVYGEDDDLYILDDPLSAVDPKVARHIFENVICGLLDGKPRILVTHQLQFVKHCDSIAVLRDGYITSYGSSKEVLENKDNRDEDGDKFLAFLQDKNIESEVQSIQSESVPSTEHGDEYHHDQAQIEDEESKNDDALNVELMRAQTISSEQHEEDSSKEATDNAMFKIGSEEDKESGNTPLSTYIRFFGLGEPYLFVIGTFLLLILQQASMMGADYYLSRLVSWPVERQAQPKSIGIYLGLIVIMVCLSLLATAALFHLVLCASQKLFTLMLESTLAAPLAFFQAQPLGRILNRFSKDQSNIDELLPFNFVDTAQSVIQILGAVVFVCIANYWIVISLPFIFGLFYYLRQVYMSTSRQVKRIESITRSPVYAHLSEALDGLPTIRSFNAGSRFIEKFEKAQNRNSRAFFTFLGAARWLGFRLDTTTALFFCLSALTIVAMRDSIRPGMVGLSLSYILLLIGNVQWAIRQSIEVEITFISVERNMAYTILPKEETEDDASNAMTLTGEWPTEGEVEFKSLNLCYPSSTKPSLRNVSLKIGKHEKIGVIGRTGAGKSSLLSCLFRLVEPYPKGCLEIDGIDISRLRLRDLRSHLSIIPQEPFLFEGTIRFNIDPFCEYSDEQIWAALEAAELKKFISRLPSQLETPVVENGRNFSVGQRQLISMCRAILHNRKVVVMDEATANVDLHTDKLIQRSIHSHFSQATVLTIAHRLHTVICEGYDRILVLDQGRVVEFGEPWELLQDSSGWLSRIVAETGPETAKALRSAAEEHYIQKNGQI